MEITKESVPGLLHGHQAAGTSRIRLTDLDIPVHKGVLMRCPGSEDAGGGNTAPVWVGGNGVTADSAATGGIPILPGDSLFVPIERPMSLFIISTDADQDVAWIGL